jgi:peptidoglycan/LPS O-acetylase OafA/YrhL
MGKKISLSSNIEVLGANSYGIYLSHVIVIEICARLIYHVLPFLLGQTVILLGILVFMGITIPLLMMHLSRKFPIKPIYSYLWG